MRGRIRTHDLQLQEELGQALSWWGDFDVIVVPADEAGMIALYTGATAPLTTPLNAQLDQLRSGKSGV